MQGTVKGKSKVGAPYKSHAAQLRQCLKRKGITVFDWEKMAADKVLWKKLIKKTVTLPVKIKSRLFAENWEVKPNLAIGRFIEKKFATKYYAGVVIATDIDKDTSDQIWEIEYDDGDIEDFNSKQLKKVLCEEGDCDIYDRRGLVASAHSMNMRHLQ
jgi:hypothetical protein